MALAEVLKAGPRPDSRRRCGVVDWISTLDGDEHTAAVQMLADARNWPATALEPIFRSEGCPVGRNTIDRHRREECSCVA